MRLFGSAFATTFRLPIKALLILLPTLLSCAADAPLDWREPQRPASDCTGRDAHLCELDRSVLRTASHEQAYTICFVNDGYEDIAPYHDDVDEYIEGLVSNGEGFVAMAPELFSFVRVDLISETAQVNDDDRFDTALGSHLRDDVLLCSVPVIGADERRVALARKSCGSADAIVLIAKDSEGRALADGSVVLMSSEDDWKVLQHELGHALFGLGDEYTEFEWCSERAPSDPYEMLPKPNVDFAQTPKWRSIIDSIELGGGHWPCLAHPTSTCAMLDSSETSFCPVCQAHIQEALDGKKCSPDTYAPRMTWVSTAPRTSRSNRFIDVFVAAHDETALGDYRFLIDGEIAHEGPMARESLSIETLEPGLHELEVQVTDSAGNVGSTGPRTFYQYESPLKAAPTISLASRDVDELGWLNLVVDGPSSGRVEATIDDEVFQSSFSSGSAEISVPASSTGANRVSLVAIDGRGLRSKPLVLAFSPPRQVPSSLSISAATIGSRPVASIDRIIGEVEIEIELESCSPLGTLELRNTRDLVLSEGSLLYTGPCTYAGTLSIRAEEAPRDFVVHVADLWDNQARIDLPQLSSLPSGTCPEPEVIAPLGSFSSPWRIDVPGSVAARLSVRGPSSVNYSLAAPSPSTEVEVYPGADALGLDMEDSRIDVTVTQRCDGLIVASRTELAVVADMVPPTLRAQFFGRDGAPMTITVSDGGEIARLEASWFADDSEMTFDTPPFEVPVRPGKMQLRAIDTLGNVRSRDIDMHAYPSGTRAQCEGGAR